MSPPLGFVQSVSKEKFAVKNSIEFLPEFFLTLIVCEVLENFSVFAARS
jgi:hypothetical protein